MVAPRLGWATRLACFQVVVSVLCSAAARVEDKLSKIVKTKVELGLCCRPLEGVNMVWSAWGLSQPASPIAAFLSSQISNVDPAAITESYSRSILSGNVFCECMHAPSPVGDCMHAQLHISGPPFQSMRSGLVILLLVGV